jgi:hypothetical protein
MHQIEREIMEFDAGFPPIISWIGIEEVVSPAGRPFSTTHGRATGDGTDITSVGVCAPKEILKVNPSIRLPNQSSNRRPAAKDGGNTMHHGQHQPVLIVQ